MEALSRGAVRVDFVERAEPALKVLRANLARLGVTERFEIYPSSVSGYLRQNRKQKRFDLVFLDPPYDAAEEYALTLGRLGGAPAEWLNAGAAVIAEHRRKEKLGENYGELKRTRLLEQGDAALSFYASGAAITESQEVQG
jgi:16S rRNA G966 N2-methylase RsmD